MKLHQRRSRVTAVTTAVQLQFTACIADTVSVLRRWPRRCHVVRTRSTLAYLECHEGEERTGTGGIYPSKFWAGTPVTIPTPNWRNGDLELPTAGIRPYGHSPLRTFARMNNDLLRRPQWHTNARMAIRGN